MASGDGGGVGVQPSFFNPKRAVTVGPNCTSHLFTMEELEACMYVSSEALLRWPAVWHTVNNAGLSTLSHANCTLSISHRKEIVFLKTTFRVYFKSMSHVSVFCISTECSL